MWNLIFQGCIIYHKNMISMQKKTLNIRYNKQLKITEEDKCFFFFQKMDTKIN